ncbi:DUF4198 domain-containing protein [Photobacterium sp. SDRW27]|uniref:DUF4198 domain-containing protein n=1 Tax=Photobacterium obscurum TaxID=2829490 RepID=UPI0022440D8B|nr:DUF4198 domain-containing protein [Photobacterium obscurum]MCW8329117.1 DUF4198 domain-containing protein [Photobacterium obscurum]
MKKTIFFSVVASLFASPYSWGHFLAITPQNQVIENGAERTQDFDVYFTHPMTQGPIMAIDKPEEIGYWRLGKKEILSENLKEISIEQQKAWSLKHQFRRPGTYTFYVNQKPYIEKSENIAIAQYAKVVMDTFAAGEEWAPQLNTPVEIIPLTRPFGLWTNSVFTGRVLKNGKPAAGVSVEVEYDNKSNVPIIKDAYAKHITTTNAYGEFSVTLPKAGWWGIAALVEADEPIEIDGKSYPLEQAGVIWLQAVDFE